VKTHPRSLAQAPFGYAPSGYAQGRRDRMREDGARGRALCGTTEVVP